MPSKATLPELKSALLNAHKAGDTRAATAIATEIKRRGDYVRGAPAEAEGLMAGARQQVAQNTGPFMAAGVAAGSAFNDLGENMQRGGQWVGENLGLLSPESGAALEQRLTQEDAGFRALQDERRVATGIGRTAAQIAMTAPVPGGVAGGMLARTATGAAAGGATALATMGPDEDPYTSFTVGAIGGAVAPHIVRGISSVVTRLAKKPMQVMVDGKFTDEALEFLEKAQIAPDDLNRQTMNELRRVGALTREQAERFNLFKEFDPRLEPTQAQLTRTATDFVGQQQAAKLSGVMREGLEQQEAIIRENVDGMITSFGGRAVDSVDASNALARVTQDRINAADEAVSAVYIAVRESLADAKVVRAERLAKTLRSYASDDPATAGMLSAIKGDLVRRGILSETDRLQGRVSVEVAERVRQNINAIIADNPQMRSRVGRALKDALDEDVAAAVGDDAFKPARAAKAKLERSLERARRTRRDAGPDTLLEKVVENRVNPDQLIPEIMARTKYRAEDVEQFVAFLKSGDAGDIQQGMEALHELRSGIVRELLAKANVGTNVTESGIPMFSGAKFAQALDAMGDRKLRAIFDDEQLTLLGRLRRVGELRTPLPGTALGTGPSGLAVEMLGDKVTNLADKATFGFASAVRQLTRTRQEVAAARAMLAPAQPTEKALAAAGRIRARPVPGAAGAVVSDRWQSESEE